MGPITLKTKQEAFCLEDPSDSVLLEWYCPDQSSLFTSNLSLSDQESMSSDDMNVRGNLQEPTGFRAGTGHSAGRRTIKDEVYIRRRQRNNAAVRRSREKARERQRDSAKRLAELTAENSRLQMKASVLLKELSLLRGLFPGDQNQQLLSEVDSFINSQ